MLLLVSAGPAVIIVPNSWAANSSHSEEETIPFWPISALDKNERTARLKLLFGGRDFLLVRTSDAGSSEKCVGLYNSIKKSLSNQSAPNKENQNSAFVLDPDNRRAFSGGAGAPPEGTACTNIIHPTIYGEIHDNGNSNFHLYSDESFRKASEEEKRQLSAVSYTANFNTEYYDLSKYYDQGGWFVVGEGVTGNCKNLDAAGCRNRFSYNRYYGVLALKFDPSTCEQNFFPWVFKNIYRLHTQSTPLFNWSWKEVGVSRSYRETGSFTSVVDIAGVPYLLAVRTNHPLADIWKMQHGDETGIAISPLLSQQDHSRPMCTFSQSEKNHFLD